MNTPTIYDKLGLSNEYCYERWAQGEIELSIHPFRLYSLFKDHSELEKIPRYVRIHGDKYDSIPFIIHQVNILDPIYLLDDVFKPYVEVCELLFYLNKVIDRRETDIYYIPLFNVLLTLPITYTYPSVYETIMCINTNRGLSPISYYELPGIKDMFRSYYYDVCKELMKELIKQGDFIFNC